MSKVYVIYDGRAIDEDGVDRATALQMCNSLEEAVRRAPDYGDYNCIWEYDFDEEETGPYKLNNGRLVEIVEPEEEREEDDA